MLTAQTAAAHESADTTVVADSVRHTPRFDPVPAAMGLGMFALGAGAHYAYPRTYSIPSRYGRPDRGADIMQFTPMALPWVMKLAGQPTRSDWKRMAVSQALSTALMAAAVYPMKERIHSRRPEGIDDHSFPSGHTAIAFMGATMVAEELGWRSPWYSIGAYTVATGVALERVIDKHHFPTDIMAGAGIGILATRLGYYLSDLMFNSEELSRRLTIMGQNRNFSYLSLETGLLLPLGHIAIGEGSIERMPTLTAGFRGGAALSDSWGIALDLGLTSMPLIVNMKYDRTYVTSLHSLGLVLSPTFTHVCSDRISVTAEAGTGYYRNFHFKTIGDAITAGNGTWVGRFVAGTIMRFSEHFSARASVGWQLSRYSFSIEPSAAYHIPSAGHASGTTSSLLVNVSSRYEF